jgi:DNA-directed RNA polymerase subunit RPC12/RpoP
VGVRHQLKVLHSENIYQLQFKMENMGKVCTSCGKQLSFFFGLFNSVCDECSHKIDVKMNVDNKSDKTNSQNYGTKIGGEIAYFGLQDWWFNELTKEERDTILSIYQPFGFSKNSLIEGKISYTDQTAIGLLTGLLSWFKKPEYQKISSKIIKKVDSMSSKTGSVMDKHFFLSTKIQTLYRNRDANDSDLSAAIEACKEQISISANAKRAFLKEYPGSPLPSHVGYNQLCIILEKQKNYEEVIRLSKKAKEQGWMGDWDKRIERCMKKQKSK